MKRWIIYLFINLKGDNMNRNISGYTGIVNYKIEKKKKRKVKFTILGIVFMIAFFLVVILNNKFIRDNQYKTSYTKEEFIEVIKDKAISNYNEYGVLPSITMAQAILESGYGNSILASEYKNLFGIKANEGYKGKSITFETKEEYDNVIVSAFRAYDNFDKSIEDHGKFLTENKRYSENGLFEGQNYKEQAKALEDAGYATVKDEEGNEIYAELLIGIVEENDLDIYD